MGDVALAGRTVILVSHQLNQIRRLCSAPAWIDGGSLRQTGPTPEVVGAYEAAMNTTARDPNAGRSSQNLKARFVSWRVVEPSSDSPHRLDSVGAATIAFALESNSAVRYGHHGIALFDLDRRLMWAPNSSDGLSFEPGIHELTYTFPFLPLCPKIYNWQVSLWDDTRNIDLWEALPELIVAAPNYQHAKDEWNGVLNLPASLTATTEGNLEHFFGF